LGSCSFPDRTVQLNDHWIAHVRREVFKFYPVAAHLSWERRTEAKNNTDLGTTRTILSNGPPRVSRPRRFISKERKQLHRNPEDVGKKLTAYLFD
jgi:hypothetical protein